MEGILESWGILCDWYKFSKTEVIELVKPYWSVNYSLDLIDTLVIYTILMAMMFKLYVRVLKR